MKKHILKTIAFSLLLVTIIQCNNSKNRFTNTIKLNQNDPFKSTIVPSRNFEIDGKIDNIVEGENGTIIVCPKGCFIDSKGEIVEEKIKIELSEALSLEEMILSNLTTTSNGKPLETDGMIYFNATANGKQLFINLENPIHIEIPTTKKKPGMMAYKGIRDENGNMNWTDPIELDKYLVPVDINLLDFLPEGFQAEVSKGIPYKNYKTATEKLADSLYYSLSVSKVSELKQGHEKTDYNEPYNNKDSKTKDYVNESDSVGHDTIVSPTNCGIDPAIIKVIKSEKFQNTLIATREFESRLKIIFKTCNNSILEIYIKNLYKDLYELDNMAAISVGEKYSKDFYNFSRQGLTNVKEVNKYSTLLKGYYEARLSKVKADLEKEKEKAIKILNKKNEEAQQFVEKYKKLLFKREKYRMETYGFNWTETGWINVDNGTIPKDWGPEPLEINVNNGKDFDRVYTYVIYTSIKSLYRLNSSDKTEFHVGNEDEKQMLMPKKKLGIAISIGYKGENVSMGIKEFETGSETKLTLNLSSSSLDNVQQAISPYEQYSIENRISKDLESMATLYKEDQRQKVLQEEREFIIRLWYIAYPCCEREGYVIGSK